MGGAATAQSDDIKAMISHIPHPPSRPSRKESWSRRGPAATGHLREWRTTVWLALTLVVAGCGATYREVRPSEPIGAAGGDLRVDVQRVFLTDDTIENGVADGMGLVVELAVANGGPRPYSLKPTTLWCLMQVDARKPKETRLLPPSVNGDGAFPGAPPEGADLNQIDVAPGQTQSFWVLFRGYQFAGSDLPRRITLTMPDAEGGALELVLADPARGDLRWEVPPTRSAWYLGVRSGSLYGGYAQATAISTRVSRLARGGAFSGTSAILVGGGAGRGGAPLVELVVHGHRVRRTPDPAPLLLGRPDAADPARPLPGGPDSDADRHRSRRPTRRPQAPPIYGQGGPEAGSSSTSVRCGTPPRRSRCRPPGATRCHAGSSGRLHPRLDRPRNG